VERHHRAEQRRAILRVQKGVAWAQKGAVVELFLKKLEVGVRVRVQVDREQEAAHSEGGAAGVAVLGVDRVLLVPALPAPAGGAIPPVIIDQIEISPL